MDTEEYTVTEHAGRYVAGTQAKKGDTLALTEQQAEAELLTGAIVPKGKGAPVFEGTKRLAGIQARAKGFDTPAEAEAAEEAGQAPPADPPDAGKPGARKPAASAPSAA